MHCTGTVLIIYIGAKAISLGNWVATHSGAMLLAIFRFRFRSNINAALHRKTYSYGILKFYQKSGLFNQGKFDQKIMKLFYLSSLKTAVSRHNFAKDFFHIY